jgi:hypothetical protein
MTRIALSRRNLLKAGACAFAGAASTHAWIGSSTTNEEIVRKYYAAWEKKDWSPFDILLAENFTFTSANNDEHISKSAFKARCWESQIDFIERFELERVIGNGKRGVCEVSWPDQERQIVPQRGLFPAQERKGGGHRVLFRRAIRLSVCGEH